MYELIAFISLFVSCIFLARIFWIKGGVEYVFSFFLLFSANIIIIGYVLSYLNRLGEVRSWAAVALAISIVSAGFLRWIKIPVNSDSPDPRNLRIIWYELVSSLSSFEKAILIPLAITTALIQVLNLAVILFSAPHNWDSLTYHLARMAYYLQHESLAYYDANYWAQVVHPKGSTILFIFSYLVSGKNENITQLVQYISYLVSVIAVYAISEKVGNSKRQSLFAALVSSLLTEWMMQSTTAQNDMILTAFIGVAVYFIFSFRKTQKRKDLALAAFAIGLSISIKSTALIGLVPVAIIVLYIFLRIRNSPQFKVRSFVFFAASTLVLTCLFAGPSGYLENYYIYGHPIAPQYVRNMHSFEDQSFRNILVNGTKNVIRFGFEFLSLDGLPPTATVQSAQNIIRFVPVQIFRLLAIEFETPDATFVFRKMPTANEDTSYWGIFGFALGWLAVLFSVVGVIRSADYKIFSLAAIAFLFAQSFVGPFDPWRGRYFIIAAIFVMPITGFWLRTTSVTLYWYLSAIVIIGCVSSITAVLFRVNSPLLNINIQGVNQKSIFSMSREEQLTRSAVDYYQLIQKFDQIVPPDATVAVLVYEDAMEYPFFGRGLTRTIIPINSFLKGRQPIPVNAQYLLYIETFPCIDINADVDLSGGWYLRELNETNRQCP